MPKINRDGVNIYYEVHGSGPPLLLTHGYSSTSGMWQGQIAALSKHHKLVLWDMRGHGQSDYPADPSAYSEAHTVADIAALLDTVGADKAIVGGLSLGGYMSLAFYRAHPDRVRAPLIIDTDRASRRTMRARPGTSAPMIPATVLSARPRVPEIRQPGTLRRHPPQRSGTRRGPRAAC